MKHKKKKKKKEKEEKKRTQHSYDKKGLNTLEENSQQQFILIYLATLHHGNLKI